MSTPDDTTEPSNVELPRVLMRLWHDRAEADRAPEPRRGLTLARILGAAIEIADDGGLEGVTMARVAKRLGFTTMSLYRHVESKEELLVLMLDAVLEPPASLDEPTEDWRTGLERWCWEMRHGLKRHPWVERVPVGGLVGTPSQLGWMDRGLAAMADTTLSEQERGEVLLLLNGYVYWEARLHADLARAEADDMPIERFDALMWAVTDSDRFPAARRAIEAGIFNDEPGDDRDSDFSFGLARVLDGVALLIDQRARG
jgi:AcrR family transcriptional regulator